MIDTGDDNHLGVVLTYQKPRPLVLRSNKYEVDTSKSANPRFVLLKPYVDSATPLVALRVAEGIPRDGLDFESHDNGDWESKKGVSTLWRLLHKDDPSSKAFFGESLKSVLSYDIYFLASHYVALKYLFIYSMNSSASLNY